MIGALETRAPASVTDQRALSSATRRLVAGRNLGAAEARAAVSTLLDESTDQLDAAAFLTAMSAKSASAVEVAEAVSAILAVAQPIDWTGPAVDIVGTGGDGSDSVNISTIAALIASAAGATVAKAGNRAATSQCGSADLIEALGIPLGPLSQVPRLLGRYRFAFIFTRAVHPALARLAPIRHRLGFATLLNLAGPLANPVPLNARLIGTANDRHQDVVAEAAQLLGMRRTWVVRGHDGVDELTTMGSNRVLEVNGGITQFELSAADLGLLPADRSSLRGFDVAGNAAAARRVLSGVHGPVSDTCLLNAAAIIHLAGIAEDLAAGVALGRAVMNGASANALVGALAAAPTGPQPSNIERGPRNKRVSEIPEKTTALGGPPSCTSTR